MSLMLNVTYAERHILAICAECCYAECRHADCRYAECCYAECHYTECRYAVCRGAVFTAICLKKWNGREK